MDAADARSGMSGRGSGPGKQCLCSSARLYLKRLHRPPYSWGRKLRRNVRVMGCIVACSRVRVVDAVRAAPGQAGRRSAPYPRCPARELLAGRYA